MVVPLHPNIQAALLPHKAAEWSQNLNLNKTHCFSFAFKVQTLTVWNLKQVCHRKKQGRWKPTQSNFLHSINFYIHFCSQSWILLLLCQKATCLNSSMGQNFCSQLMYCMVLLHIIVPVAWRCKQTGTQMPLVRPRFRKQWKKQFERRNLKQEKHR